MPVFVNSLIFISARGGAYHVSGFVGSFSSNSHKKFAVASACSAGTAFLITMYPLVIQNFQSSSLRTRNGLPLLRSFNFVALLLAVDGLPGMSLCAFSGTIVPAIVVAIVSCCI